MVGRDCSMTPSVEPSAPAEKRDFSLVLGGPLYQLYLRAHLARAPIEEVPRRVIAAAVVTWVPVLVLTALGGHLMSGVAVPFLFDIDTHARFLVSLPLLISAELVVHRRLRPVAAQFVDRGLIAPSDASRFDGFVRSVRRLRNSVVIEAILLVAAFTVGYWIWRDQVALHVATWYADPAAGRVQLTYAGYWYAFVGLPINRFIMARWYYRLFIWYLFLWRVSRLRLVLNPLHPDGAGGIGFLGNTAYAFGPVLMAHTVLLSGVLANLIWHEGASLPQFKLEIATIMVALLLLAFVPLFFFIVQMSVAKRAASRQFGQLASRYAGEFRRKWLDAPGNADEPLLGSADIQSLADLANSFNVVRTMRLLPFGKNHVFALAVFVALPLSPLVLTMIPIEQIVSRLFKMLL